MAQNQVSIGTTGRMKDVIAEARRIYEDAETDSQALRRALFDWYVSRQSDSKRGALNRIEQNQAVQVSALTELQEAVRRHEQRFDEIMQRLASIETRIGGEKQTAPQ